MCGFKTAFHCVMQKFAPGDMFTGMAMSGCISLY